MKYIKVIVAVSLLGLPSCENNGIGDKVTIELPEVPYSE